jgi:hypothetical protein
MATTYFGFAIADAMFPPFCTVSRRTIAPGEVRDLLLSATGVEMCLNPSHTPTVEVAKKKYDLCLVVPPKAPVVSLNVGDKVIVMSPRGLPRLEGRHEYTLKEIEGATFDFGEWTVT